VSDKGWLERHWEYEEAAQQREIERMRDRMIADLHAPKYHKNPGAWWFWTLFGVLFVGGMVALAIWVVGMR